MLNLVIKFNSSLTNQLADEDHNMLFSSSKTFSDGLRKLNKVSLDEDAPPNQTLVHHIRKMNLENPGMSYRVPINYDNTIKGIVARLCGEIRRLSDLEEDHPLHALFERISYNMHVESEHSETYALATPPNALQTSGSGVVPKGNPFYSNTDIAKKIFGHLEYGLDRQIQASALKGAWYPKSPFEIINRLNDLKKEQDALVNAQKKILGEEYISPFSDYERWFKQEISEYSIDLGLNDYWNIGGSRIALNILKLEKNEKMDLISKGFLTRNGNIQGIAMSGGIGNVTPKDLYVGAGCRRAYSTRMPYSTDLWFEAHGANVKLALGMIKKSGTIHIQCDLLSEQAEYWLNKINSSAVGPFHFGKKGIAYVQRMYIN